MTANSQAGSRRKSADDTRQNLPRGLSANPTSENELWAVHFGDGPMAGADIRHLVTADAAISAGPSQEDLEKIDAASWNSKCSCCSVNRENRKMFRRLVLRRGDRSLLGCDPE
jgi:hypothetical protein